MQQNTNHKSKAEKSRRILKKEISSGVGSESEFQNSDQLKLLIIRYIFIWSNVYVIIWL